MNYTVIAKSGWSGDSWRLRRRLEDKSTAQHFVYENKSTLAHDKDHHMAIMAHRKSLLELVDHETGVITFSNGTRATWENI